MAEREKPPKLVSKTVIDRFKVGMESAREQRRRENEALKFMDPKFQWAPEAIAARESQTIGGATIPARPRLSISKIDQPIQLVKNGFRNANLDINIHPLSPGADKKTAEIFQGIIRQISRDSNANLARTWAFDRSVEAGFGTYRILTDYDESADDPMAQKIVIKRIRYQEAVVFDPAANEADYSDGKFAFITSYMTKAAFKEAYPKAQLSSADDSIFAELQKERPDWVDVDNENKGILVAEYYCKHEKVDDNNRPYTAVYWYKVCAGSGVDEVETLDSEVWNGSMIPLIPTIGKELQSFDRERRYMGVVEPAMDSQRGFNYSITNAVELGALEPRAPVIGAEGQFEGHEAAWDTANVRNWSRLEYKPTTFEGHLMPPPQRMQIDGSRLSVSMQLAQIFDQAIQATTSTPDPALGKSHKEDSGKKIEALQSQSVASTSNYMTNMMQISLMLEGKQLIDMIPRVYVEPGRIIQIVDVQDETQEVMINAPFVMGDDGRPQMAPEGQQGAQIYDLRKGKYGIAVKPGPSYDSKFEQGQKQMEMLVGASPEMMLTLGDIFFKYSSAPWSSEAEKRMKKIIEKQNPEFYAPDQPGSETPDQLRQMLEASKQQIAALNQQLQMAMQALEQDKQKQMATLEKAKMDNETKIASEQMESQRSEREAEFKIALEEIKAQNEAMLAELKETAETERLLLEQRFKALQAELDRQAEEKNLERQAQIAQSQAEQAAAHEAGMEGQRQANDKGDDGKK